MFSKITYNLSGSVLRCVIHSGLAFALAGMMFAGAGEAQGKIPKKTAGKSSSAKVDMKYKAGDAVEVYDGKKWHLGKILDVKDDKYRVHFDSDTSGKNDRWVTADFVQDRGTTAGLGAASGQTESGGASGGSGDKKTKAAKYAVGDTVEAIYYGQWYRATIEKITSCCDYVVKWTKDGTTYNQNDSRMRIPAVFNFSGENYKVGQYVYVWYSNAWLEAPIKEIKDDKMLIPYGGYGDKWFDFADLNIKNEKREKAIKAAAELENAFFAECKKYSPAVGYLANEYNPELDHQYMGQSKSVTEALQQLEELDLIYKAKYSNLQNTEKVWTTRLDKMPTFWGEIAAKRKELAAKMAARPFREQVTKYRGLAAALADHNANAADLKNGVGSGIGSSREFDNMLDGDGSVYMTWQMDALKYYFDPAKEAGVYDQKLVDSLIAETKKGYQAVRAKFAAEISKAQPAWNVTGHEAAGETFGSNAIKKDYPGSTILHTGALGDWQIERTDIGIIKGRSREIAVAFKTANGRCMVALYWYWQDYAGGSSYSGGKFRDVGYSDWYQKCN